MNDENNVPLPCDLWVGHTVFHRGVAVGTVQGAINRLYSAYKAATHGMSIEEILKLWPAEQVSTKTEKTRNT